MAQHDSTSKTVGVALAVTIISSVIVSTLVVMLRPIQDKNKTIEKKRNVLLAVGIEVTRSKVEAEYSRLFKERIIDITTGKIYDEIDPAEYNKAKLMRDKNNVIHLDKKQNTIGIPEICKYQKVYIVEKDGKIESIVLEILGKGLWSTMKGFIALKSDLNTIQGMTFYSHGETPGLGGEVDNPKWKAEWPGKMMYSSGGETKITVIKTTVLPSDPDKDYKISGLSGATLTTRGVNELVRFWAGEYGYKKFLTNLKNGTEGSK